MNLKVKRVADLKKNCSGQVTVETLNSIRVASLALSEETMSGPDPLKKRTRQVTGLGVSKK
eukprot:2173231-Amphidinium_carterae.1